MPKKNEQRVAVVVPVLNGENTLESMLVSILEQTYQNFYVIVVDNGSTDATAKITKSFAKNHQNIHYVFEPYISRGAARNKGIETAQSDIIVMTDSDCIVPKNWITKLIAPILYERETIVMGSEYDIRKTPLTKLIQKLNDTHLQNYINGNYINYLDSKNFAIKTSVAKGILFDRVQKNSEDFEFSIRLRDCYKIRYTPEIKVGHYHIETLLLWWMKTYDRAYWTSRVFFKYRNNPSVTELPVFIACIRSDTKHFFRSTYNEFFNVSIIKTIFDLITGLAWRLGTYHGIKKYKNYYPKS